MPLLSVIIPVYNEEKTIAEIIRKIDSVAIEKEIIVVNNASNDKTQEILDRIKLTNLKLFFNKINLGKGAGIKTGLKKTRGDIIIIQDADLEYNPFDYNKLILPIINDQADLVLGARFTKGYKGLFWHRFGNRLLTGLLNLLYGCRLNDTHTCYKAAKRNVYNNFDLQADDFSIDQEIVSKALKKKLKIIEIPISYYPRSYAEGKKIRFVDAFRIILAMLRLRFKKG